MRYVGILNDSLLAPECYVGVQLDENSECIQYLYLKNFFSDCKCQKLDVPLLALGTYQYLEKAFQKPTMVEVEGSPDFWSGPVQSYNSPVEHRFLIGLDRPTYGPLPDCDRKYVSVWTMPPGFLTELAWSRARWEN